MASDIQRELHDFIIALARAGSPEGHVPLEVFANWCEIFTRGAVKNDEYGAFIDAAGGAIKIRPVTTTATMTFKTADEVASFIEVSKELKHG